MFLALAHEAIPAIAPPELFDRMAYIGKPAQLTTNVYRSAHISVADSSTETRFALSPRFLTNLCRSAHAHQGICSTNLSRCVPGVPVYPSPNSGTPGQPISGIRHRINSQRKGGEGGNCGAVTQIIAWFARARNQVIK
jgi:hypothetical protein